MKQSTLIGLILLLGFAGGAFLSPLVAQQQPAAGAQHFCAVGENSNAACVGRWVYFSGNTSNIDSGVWVVRVDGGTGEIAYRDGKKLVRLAEPN